MNHQIDITQASVYVGTYHKYNVGSLFGKWMMLSDFDDLSAFYSACAALHEDEDDPEFMFQDYEHIPKGLISECGISENAFGVLEVLREMDGDELEPFLIWCDNGHRDLSGEDIHDLTCAFQSEYMGKYDDEEAFAHELVAMRDDLSEFALSYFDYGAYARDLFCGDYWSEDGHVFLNC